jgi:uncharacterized protein with PQ loop repeat
MVDADIFGYIGAIMLSLLYMPQVHNAYRLKLGREISTFFLLLNYLTVTNLLVYSIMIEAYPFVVAESSVGLCTILLTIIKFSNRNKDKVAPDIIVTNT